MAAAGFLSILRGRLENRRRDRGDLFTTHVSGGAPDDAAWPARRKKQQARSVTGTSSRGRKTRYNSKSPGCSPHAGDPETYSRRIALPELRKDPITGRWVIISTERGKRPNDFLRESVIPREEKNCPFCAGNESRTPPEILVYGRNGGGPNTPGWSIRVVPNKFPALGIEGELDREGEGLFDKMNGIGAHEVVIESPNHLATLATLPERSVEDVLWGYRDRMLDLKNDKRFRYILIFKNHGEAAGATIDHPHSQLIALPIVP